MLPPTDPYALDHLRHADRRAAAFDVATRVAHELGTPLAVLAARTEILGKSLPPELQEHIGVLVSSVQRASETLRKFVSAKERAPEARRERIAGLVQGAIASCSTSKVRIVSAVHPDLVMCVDPTVLAQVLTELLSNSVAAAPHGGTVTVHAERERVDEPPDAHARPGVFLRIEIRDGGPGITRDELLRYTDPPREERAFYAGSGLSVCACVLREHDGFLSAPAGGGPIFAYLHELEEP